MKCQTRETKVAVSKKVVSRLEAVRVKARKADKADKAADSKAAAARVAAVTAKPILR
jgi:hypothetical protein